MSRFIQRGIFVIFLTTIFLLGCSDNHSKPLHLGTNVWPGYEPLFLARSLGYLKNEEIKLVEFISSSEVMRAFTNQSLDAAALTLDEALLLLEQGIDITIILVNDISNGADVILGKPDIKVMPSLIGKRVGVEGNALGAYTLARALELHHLSLEDIEIIQLEVNEHEKAYKEDLIDAVVTFEPVRTKLLNKGAHELFSSREIPDEIVDVLVVSNSRLKLQVSNIQKLVNGWFKALDYLNKFPEDAAQRMTARLKMTPEEILSSFKGLYFPNREENIRLITGSNPALLSTAQRLQSIMATNKLLQKDIQAHRLFKTHPPGLTH